MAGDGMSPGAATATIEKAGASGVRASRARLAPETVLRIGRSPGGRKTGFQDLPERDADHTRGGPGRRILAQPETVMEPESRLLRRALASSSRAPADGNQDRRCQRMSH